MKDIYQVRICGRVIESRNIRQLLANAVAEKRNMDRKLRFLPVLEAISFPGGASASFSRSAAGSPG